MRSWLRVLVAIAGCPLALACGPSVTAGGEESSTTATSADATGADSSSGVGSTSAGDSTTSAGPSTSDSADSTGDEPPEGTPACVAYASYGIYVDPPYHADVDGDGAAELWTIAPTEPPTLTSYHPTIVEAIVAHELSRPGTDFGFGDIDGDGRDDLVATDGVTTQWYAGQPDGSLSMDAAPVTVAGPWAFSLADADGDGDDDLLRVQPGAPAVVEVLENDGGVFSVTSSQPLPNTVDGMADPAAIFSRESGFELVLQLSVPGESEQDSVLVDLRMQADAPLIEEIHTSDVGRYRYVGEADVDGDGVSDLVAQKADETRSIVSFSRSGGALNEQQLLPHSAYGAIGDFEGTGTRQLLYRYDDPEDDGPWLLRIYRFDEQAYGEVIVNDLFGAPLFHRAFDYDLDGVDESYVEFCEFGCYAGMAELVPC